MKTFFYWSCVVLSIALTIAINLIFDFRLGVVWEFLISLLVVITPSIIFNFIERFFPEKWYGENVKLFKERKFENSFFKIIHIKKWKDNVPQFLKIKNINKAKDENSEIDAIYVNNFITETRRGEFMHLIDIIFGMIAALFLPKAYFFKYSLPIILIWTYFNALSIIIQRYNRPRLQKLLTRMEKYNNENAIINEENAHNEI